MNTSILDIQLLNQQSGRLVDVVTIILHIEMLKYSIDSAKSQQWLVALTALE